jgi:DNA primase
MDSPIEEIKERLDVVDVISSYIKLQKTGANYRAICPFHSEQKPSFFVSPTRQLWRCFGCGKGGDIFAFIQEIEGVEFGDALRILAQRAGVELKRQDPQVQSQRQKLYEICEAATKFYEKQLQEGKNGKKAKEYLLQRDIKEESIKEWRLGFAPNLWNSLGDFLKEKGYSIGEIQRAGLALANEQGKVYDRFRARIIFPIFDLNSQVIGFGGRFFGTKEGEEKNLAKYLNIPNTLLYNKSKVLYGLNKAKVPIRKQDACILVEGYTDVILSHQSGIKNAVATSGTALTPPQLTILKRYYNNLITAFDMDIAGDSATARGINLAQAQGFDIRVAVLPQGKDPADIASKSAKNWGQIIEKAKSILDFYFEKALLNYDQKNVEGKKEIARMLLPIIARIQNKIEQSHWINKLASELKVAEEKIEEELNKYVNLDIKAEEREEKNLKEPETKTRQQLIEERILTLLLTFPKKLESLFSQEIECFSEETRDILREFKKNKKTFYSKYSEFSLNDKQKELLNNLALKGEAEKDLVQIDVNEETAVCLKELSQIFKKQKMEELAQKIKQAEIEGKTKEIQKFSQQFNDLIKTLLK